MVTSAASNPPLRPAVDQTYLDEVISRKLTTTQQNELVERLPKLFNQVHCLDPAMQTRFIEFQSKINKDGELDISSKDPWTVKDTMAGEYLRYLKAGLLLRIGDIKFANVITNAFSKHILSRFAIANFISRMFVIFPAKTSAIAGSCILQPSMMMASSRYSFSV